MNILERIIIGHDLLCLSTIFFSAIEELINHIIHVIMIWFCVIHLLISGRGTKPWKLIFILRNACFSFLNLFLYGFTLFDEKRSILNLSQNRIVISIVNHSLE